MRTNRRFVSAALAAIGIVLSACFSENITNVNQYQRALIGSGGGTTPGGCSVTVRVLSVNSSAGVGTNSLTLNVGDRREIQAEATGNCPLQQIFDFVSSVPSVASIERLTDSTAVIVALAPGGTQITVTHRPTGIAHNFAVTVRANPSVLSVNPIGAISTGNGCTRTFQGVVSPAGTAGTWSVSGVNGASVNSSTGAGSVPQGATGTLRLTFTAQNGATAYIDIPVNATDCSQPTTVTVSPTGQSISTGNGCSRTLQMSATTANPSGLSGTWSVSGITGAIVSSSGLVTAPAGTSGTLTVVFTASNGATGSTTIAVNTTDCTQPTLGFTWTPTSVCFSTIAGSPTTQTVRVVITGITNPTVTLVSSNNSFVGVASPVTQTGNDLTWTVNRVNAIAADGNLSLYHNGVPVSAIPWDIRTTACPGAGSRIEYSPPSSTGTVGTTATLNVIACIINGTNCTTKPFWDSSDPSRVGVRGTETETYGGMTFYVGNTATLTRVAVGSAQICVQPGVTITTPRYCGSGGNSHIVQ